MVLEHIFPEDWLEHKGRYAFFRIFMLWWELLLLFSFGDPALWE